MKRVCVIIPAYNEATVIRKVIQDAKKVFDSDIGYSIDIIVINDGSSDDTSKEARKGGAKVIEHIINSGAGVATLTGLAYAKKHGYDMAATMDADGQHAPEDVAEGIKQADRSNSDLTIGSRLIDNSGMSRTKVLGNKGLSLITKILFNVDVTDSQSGLRIYSKNAVDNLRWRNAGYEFCSEMIWRAKQSKMIVREYPIRAIYTSYSKGKGQNNWNAINIVKRLFKQRIVEMFE